MAATYSPTTHTAPTTATVASINVAGLSPGRCYVTIADALAPTTVYLPTSISSDGFPTGMIGFTSGTGAVT